MDIFNTVLTMLLISFSSAEEFCNEELFKPECAADEVVMIETALYGRMREGKCISSKFGFIGEECTEVVKRHLDSLCSGRQECRVKVSEGTFPRHVPCQKELKSYLDVEHSCLKVVRQQEECIDAGPVTVLDSEGFLSSEITYKTSCGNTQNPWLLRGKPGQRINVTLLDFSALNNSNTPGFVSAKCRVLATVKDLSKSTPSTLCQGSKIAHSVVSTRNELEVRILQQKSGSDVPSFLLHFKAFGCPDPEPSASKSIDRLDSDNIKITCHSTGHVTQIRCQDDQWVGGPVVNCPLVEPRENSVSEKVPAMSHAVAIVVIVSIAVCVSATILCIGVLCLKRSSDNYHHDPTLQQPHMKLVAIQQTVEGKPQTKLVCPDSEMNTIGRRHARMRQLYAHTAGLHPERHRDDEAPENTLDMPLNPFAHTHIYESPAEIVRSPLLSTAPQNQVRTGSGNRGDIGRLCRICGLTDNSCIHGQLDRSEIVPDFQYPQTPARTTNNYSV